MRTVSAPPVHRIVLEAWDASGATWIDIREPRLNEEMRRERALTPKILERLLPGEIVEREIQETSNLELLILECWLTFGGAHIAFEDGPLDFDPRMTERDFYAAVLALPLDLVAAWGNAVRATVPSWAD